jgi:protein-S-isoprenylcysteine O-methyltransferase Ste14
MKARPRILPPAWLLISVIAQAGMHFYLPLIQFLDSPFHRFGLVPLLSGIIIMICGAGAFKREDTPVIPFEKSTALVVSGPFRFTRNPMYLGMILILTGTAVLLGSLSPFLLILVFFLLIRQQFVIPEEAMMVELFGDEYKLYRTRVRRWI